MLTLLLMSSLIYQVNAFGGGGWKHANNFFTPFCERRRNSRGSNEASLQVRVGVPGVWSQLELSGFPVLVSLPAEAGQDCKICNETQWLENKKS
jgi:hypothetical protein